MKNAPTIEQLWDSIPPSTETFQPASYAHLPEPVLRYLENAIKPGAPLASAVRLHMRGTIKLKGWLPFEAEQIIAPGHGMIWQARTRMMGLPVSGFDRLIGTSAEQRWKILGLFPVLNATGPDITRSAAGRMAIEYCWLPTALCDETIPWNQPDAETIQPTLEVAGEINTPEFRLSQSGSLQSITMKRWGNPGNQGFREDVFGGEVLGESTFGAYRIPTDFRIGWYYGSERFESDGEFFRCTVYDAEYK